MMKTRFVREKLISRSDRVTPTGCLLKIFPVVVKRYNIMNTSYRC